MDVGGESFKALALLPSQEIGPCVHCPPGFMMWVTGTSPVTACCLLKTPPALIQGIGGRSDDMERSMTEGASGSSSAVELLNPENPPMATTSTPSRRCWRRSWRPGREDVFGAALNQIQQPGRTGAVTVGARSVMTVTYLAPRRG